MTEEEIILEYAKACDRAHSHLEAPLLGYIEVPICYSCKHSDYTEGWKPKCAKHGDMPPKYMNGDDYDCPDYELNPNCPKCRLPTPPEKRLKKRLPTPPEER